MKRMDEADGGLPFGVRMAVGFLRLCELALTLLLVVSMLGSFGVFSAGFNIDQQWQAWNIIAASLAYVLWVALVFAAFRGCELLVAQMTAAWSGEAVEVRKNWSLIAFREVVKVTIGFAAAVFGLQALVTTCFALMSGWSAGERVLVGLDVLICAGGFAAFWFLRGRWSRSG